MYKAWTIVYEDNLCIISSSSKYNFICDRFNIPFKLLDVYWNTIVHDLPSDFCEKLILENGLTYGRILGRK